MLPSTASGVLTPPGLADFHRPARHSPDPRPHRRRRSPGVWLVGSVLSWVLVTGGGWGGGWPGWGPTGAAVAHAQTGGIAIDPDGLVRDLLSAGTESPTRPHSSRPTPDTRALAAEVPYPRRIVSLRRFEQACREWLSTQAAPAPPVGEWPAELRWWGGLVAIDSVCHEPASGDVWIAGPAVDWPDGTPATDRLPTSGPVCLDLEDWLTALDYAFPRETTDDFLGVSIDPTPEGLKRFQQRLQQLSRGDLSRQHEALAAALGPQVITLYGVDPRSRFALKLLAADYRLKRLSLGLDPAPLAEFRSLPELLVQRRVTGRVPQTRWWLTPGPDVLTTNADRSVWKVDGRRLSVETGPVQGAERETASGPAANRRRGVSPVAREFAELATRLYPELVARQPAFAELTNLVSLSLVAELVRHFSELPRQNGGPGWRPVWWLSGEGVPRTAGPVPSRLAPLVEVRRAEGGSWIVCGSGGVEIRPEDLVKAAGVFPADAAPAFGPWPAAETHWWRDAASPNRTPQ